MNLTRHLISNDIGDYNTWPLVRLGQESGGRLWTVYNISANSLRTSYSEDDGVNWNEEGGSPMTGGIRNPSLNINGSNEVQLSATNPTYTHTPDYNIRSGGSWGSVENVDTTTNSSVSQILETSGGTPYCAWRYAPTGTYTQIKANKRTGGSWQTPVALSLAAGYRCDMMAACLDSSDNLHVVWNARLIADTTQYKIQTAYWNGTSWSSITDIESYTTSASSGVPIIRFVGSTLIILYSRDGVGTYTTKAQIRYSMSTDEGSTWGSPSSATDHDGHHYDYDATAGDGSDIYLVYTEYGAYAGESTIYNAAYKQWDGDSWSSKTVLTEQSADQRYISAINDGSTIHVMWRETSTTSMYHGSFTSTATPTTKEIYDYVDTIAADVDVTLSLEPQVVIPEVGGKGDIVHLADDESEERVGYSSDFKFYITIRFDLLNQSDAGTLLDIWADSSKANGRINSWKFTHPDGHTYVVRFDTDLNRLMSPTYYTIKNIRLKVLGRIIDS